MFFSRTSIEVLVGLLINVWLKPSHQLKFVIASGILFENQVEKENLKITGLIKCSWFIIRTNRPSEIHAISNSFEVSLEQKVVNIEKNRLISKVNERRKSMEVE